MGIPLWIVEDDWGVDDDDVDIDVDVDVDDGADDDDDIGVGVCCGVLFVVAVKLSLGVVVEASISSS